MIKFIENYIFIQNIENISHNTTTINFTSNISVVQQQLAAFQLAAVALIHNKKILVTTQNIHFFAENVNDGCKTKSHL